MAVGGHHGVAAFSDRGHLVVGGQARGVALVLVDERGVVEAGCQRRFDLLEEGDRIGETVGEQANGCARAELGRQLIRVGRRGWSGEGIDELHPLIMGRGGISVELSAVTIYGAAMTTTDDGRRPLPDIPFDADADERGVLVQFLEFYRAVLPRKLQGLDDAGRRTAVGASTLTLAGLVKHMAYVEDMWFSYRFANQPPAEPFASAPWDDDADWELTSAVDDSEAELLAMFDDAVERSRAVLATVDSLGDQAKRPSDSAPSPTMRWILVHMIEEYARHAGHADLLREAADGVTGD